jgi:hypothetical protein
MGQDFVVELPNQCFLSRRPATSLLAGPCLHFPGQRPSHVPDRHSGLDVQLSQRPSHRDAAVSVLDEIEVSHLDQIHWRQRRPSSPRGSDAQPTFPVVIVERAKSRSKSPQRPSLPTI